MMKKKNLVTLSDRTGLYDIMKCDQCGYEVKCYGLSRPGSCPRCHAGEPEPIWGGWTRRGVFKKGEHVCPHCGEQAIEVPKEGHPSSRYWVMAHYDDEVLYCCPNDCLETGGIQIIKTALPNYKRRN
jgi:hypothetical protein